MKSDQSKLIQAAFDAMERAYAPYSHFTVGAALLTADGRIFTGCNVENAAYGPSNCAERTAFFSAVSQGYRRFRAIAIVGGPAGKAEQFCPPCGVCRQVMAEFCSGDFEIILATRAGEVQTFTLEQLLPMRFGPDNLA